MRTILKSVGFVLLVLGVIAAIIAAFIFVPTLFGAPNGDNAANSDVASAESEIDPQCRVDGVLAYMSGQQGFGEDDFVVGEERVDKTAPEFSRTGPLGFGIDGAIVDDRASLQALFESEEPVYQLIQETQLKMLDQYDREVVLDARNWEIVQTNVASTLNGNTGLLDGAVISAGDTFSQAGDAAWVFVDSATCTVPRATHDSMGNLVDPNSAETDKPVGFIRVGCKNPGNGFVPILPPPPVVVIEPKDPSQDPGARGSSQDGRGGNNDQGRGEYTSPETTTQPPAEPRVNPSTPPTVPPATAGPAPAPTLDPAPPPPPQPSAPPSSAPETRCVPIPGIEDCS